MKLQNLSLEQLKEIVDGAPEGATHWNSNEKDDCWKYIKYDGADNYSLDDEGNWETSMEFHSHAKHGFLKLSDIRAELLGRPKFEVGDRVVIVNKPNASMELHLVLEPTNSTSVGMAPINRLSGRPILMCQQLASPRYLRHATPEEEAAGHRIDEPASSCGMTAVEIDQFGEDLRNKPYVDLPEFEQPDTITAKLDPAKCRVVDPALAYDGPGDCPKDDFDAMSEKHRSPSCKCHELPIDAELKPDPVNHPCKAAKKIKKLKKRIAQLEKERQFSELKAKDWAHKYWDSIRDNAGLYSALEEVFAERATEYEAEIERLKGEQGE